MDSMQNTLLQLLLFLLFSVYDGLKLWLNSYQLLIQHSAERVNNFETVFGKIIEYCVLFVTLG